MGAQRSYRDYPTIQSNTHENPDNNLYASRFKYADEYAASYEYFLTNSTATATHQHTTAHHCSVPHG